MTQSKIRRPGAALAVIASFLMLLPSGCGSILAFNMENRPAIYGGTQLDVAAVKYLGPLALIDLPMSFALDTGLLPFALALEVLPERE